MGFCPDCGARVEGRFCANCGRSVAGAAPSRPAAAKAGLTDDQAAALAYLLGAVTGALFLMWAPYNQSRNVRFHAFQSIFLTAGWLVLVFVIGLVFSFWVGLGFAIGRLAQLAALAGWLFIMWQTYQGHRVVVPFVGPLAEKQV